jgi:hypothetical protein
MCLTVTASIWLRRVVLAAAALSFAWAVILLLGNGVEVVMPWGRLTSRNPSRPFAVATALAIGYYLRWRGSWR